MFNCEACAKPTGPRVAPVVVVTEERSREYRELDENSVPYIAGTGKETVHEQQLCPSCAGVEQHAQPALDLKLLRAVAAGHFTHIEKCKGKKRSKTGVETPCPICVKILQDFSLFPLQALTVCLEDSQPKRGSQTMAAVCVENLVARAKHDTLRAKRDFAAGYNILRPYERRGGTL